MNSMFFLLQNPPPSCEVTPRCLKSQSWVVICVLRSRLASVRNPVFSFSMYLVIYVLLNSLIHLFYTHARTHARTLTLISIYLFVCLYLSICLIYICLPIYLCILSSVSLNKTTPFFSDSLKQTTNDNLNISD